MSNLSTLPKGDSAWLLRKAIQRIIQQVSVLETNIGSSTTGNSSNTQIIFNDNGVLRGDADLIFNTSLNKLVALNLESTAALNVGTSATITGDLTVDTTTLKVDSANNRVGIGIAAPNRNLTLYASSSPVLQLCDSTTGTTSNDGLLIQQVGVDTYIENAEVGSMFLRTSATTRATLNSSGNLGLGVTPSAWRSGARDRKSVV